MLLLTEARFPYVVYIHGSLLYPLGENKPKLKHKLSHTHNRTAAVWRKRLVCVQRHWQTTKHTKPPDFITHSIHSAESRSPVWNICSFSLNVCGSLSNKWEIIFWLNSLSDSDYCSVCFHFDLLFCVCFHFYLEWLKEVLIFLQVRAVLVEERYNL